MYKSPIELITKDVQTKIEDNIVKVIQDYDIVVDKEELIKALKYDREQYEKGCEKGYAKGYIAAKMELKNGKWETDEEGDWHCSVCKAIIEKDEQSRHYYKYCYHCGARMEVEE